MPLVYLTRRERFNAAHKLHREEWDDQKNLEVFGKCANPNWHGHNYTLWVTAKGEPDPITGYVLNLADLRDVVREKVTDKLDHRNLNLDVDFLKGIQPSTENLAVAIWEELVEEVKKLGGELHSIKVEETENNSVEYFGE